MLCPVDSSSCLDAADARRRAAAFGRALAGHINKLRAEPRAYGGIGLAELLGMREECLREFGFKDVYRCTAVGLTRVGVAETLSLSMLRCALPCPALPCPALPCPAHSTLLCTAASCPAPVLAIGFRSAAWQCVLFAIDCKSNSESRRACSRF